MYLRDSCDWNFLELLKGIFCWRYNFLECEEDDNIILCVLDKLYSSIKWLEKLSLKVVIIDIYYVDYNVLVS